MRSPNQRIKLQFRLESIHRIYIIPRTSHEKSRESSCNPGSGPGAQSRFPATTGHRWEAEKRWFNLFKNIFHNRRTTNKWASLFRENWKMKYNLFYCKTLVLWRCITFEVSFLRWFLRPSESNSSECEDTSGLPSLASQREKQAPPCVSNCVTVLHSVLHSVQAIV